MNAKLKSDQPEFVVIQFGNGRRVRIADGRPLEVLGAPASRARRKRRPARSLLAKLKAFVRAE